jgi:uncharacterized protein (DUF952 family)
MSLIYKIVSAQSWQDARTQDHFAGAAIDLRDGYVHFSTAQQVRETAQLHFAGQDGLLLVAYDASVFDATLKWEASRGGQLFPHVYASLAPSQALSTVPLPWNGTAFVFPEGFDA